MSLHVTHRYLNRHGLGTAVRETRENFESHLLAALLWLKKLLNSGFLGTTKTKALAFGIISIW